MIRRIAAEDVVSGIGAEHCTLPPRSPATTKVHAPHDQGSVGQQRSSPRILVAIHNLYADPTSGAARSVRTMTEWLAEAGFACRVLATTRPDGQGGTKSTGGGTAVLNGIPVTTLPTRHHRADQPDRQEARQYLTLLHAAFDGFHPDVLLTYGSHPLVREILRQARYRGITTVYTVRNYGYEDRRWFEHVDHVLVNSSFMARHYERTIGLRSTPIESPIAWADTDATEPLEDAHSGDEVALAAYQQGPSPTNPLHSSEESGAAPRARCLTFVNPSLHKGAALFARLADMLGTLRPDIPMLVIQSAIDGTALDRCSEVDLKRFPQLEFHPPTGRPLEFLARTRVLLVPSLFAEPFGRVAVEAMINGIPPLVSDRGALPETVREGGWVLPVPSWLTPTTTRLPSADEVRPWFDAICRLWDEPACFARASAAARHVAKRCYREDAQKRLYIEYFSRIALRRKVPLTARCSFIHVGR